MVVSFNIEYRTNWGEEVRILGSTPELGENKQEEALALHTLDGIHWNLTTEINEIDNQPIQYIYHIYKEGKSIRREWSGVPRCLYLSVSSDKAYRIFDSWKNIPEQLSFYSSAFTESLLAHNKREKAPKNYKKGLVIKAYAPRIGSDYCLAICGNQKVLGEWDANRAWPMSDINFPEWQTEIDASKLTYPLEYKFILYNKKEKRAEAWESNPNRYVADPKAEANESVVFSDRYVFFDTPVWKGAGVAVPVFSLKSENSYGVGDFVDLKLLVDWAVCTHQKVIQILPINDTTITHTWTDSYPYNSISIYALHPMYLNISRLGKLKDRKKMAAFNKVQKELNALSTMDYEAVNREKWAYFHLIFAQEGESVLNSEDFKLFFQENKEWLEPYAVFSYLRDLYQTPNFREWPKLNTFNVDEVQKMCLPTAKHYKKIALYFYLQYQLHLQLLEATVYARKHGVVLKGDIPIGISSNSVEAWTEPHYFNLNGQAGAPPDDFSVNGQNWGFPTYNWDRMEEDGYLWWMKRFQKMATYFDAYRIDHILGFFRIWQIPMNAVHGLLGQFVPALPMTREEIGSYGLEFRDSFLQPYIHESFLNHIFGPHTASVKQEFLDTTQTWEVYRMKPEFDTQRKIETYFQGKTDTDSIWIRDGLYALISNVLFVPDVKDPTKFHPRIGVQHDFIYQSLDDREKNAFNRLYDQYYYHRHNEFWHQQAMQKLPQLTQSTRMLVCGEDLGMIPDCVAWVMNDLRILSLEIQRMPKDSSMDFGRLSEYPYRSVCTFSTHDMSTLRGWWQENADTTQRYYNYILGHYGTAPAIATPELCEEVVRNHLYSNSMLCILSFQDWLSLDGQWRNPEVEAERINIPANPKHYWRYRMHLTLEKLLAAESLNTHIAELVEQSGRNPQK